MDLRDTGLSVIGTVPWGTHCCQFYSTKEDLLDILVPYFKAGLENNEYCMWVTSDPLGAKEAEAAMRLSMPGFDEYLAKGQIEIIPYSSWYTRKGRFDMDDVLNGWVKKHDSAIKARYDGLRLSGNTFWLEKDDWMEFKAYEETIDGVIGRYKMLAICTYSLEKCGAAEILDVLSNHEFALMRRAGVWEVVESFGRKQVERKLRESEEKYRIISENTYDWEFWIGPDNRYLYVSPSCKIISGHEPEEFLKDPGLRFRIVHPDDRVLLEKHVKEAENKLPGEVVYRIVRPDGQARWIGHACQPVYDSSGKSLGIRGSNRDITENKQAELKLRESGERLRALFNSMLNGFALHEIILDENGNPKDYRFLEINNAFEEILGLKREYIIGKTALEALPEIESYWIENFGKVALTGKPIKFENYAKEFDKYFEVAAYSPKRGQFAVIFADITERRKMEDELRRAKGELEQKVHERTFELVSAMSELERSNKELEQFAYVASHDLQEPLRMVSSYLQFLELKYKGQLDERADQFIDFAVKGAARMSDMINSLLSYSRVSTQGKSLEKTESAKALSAAIANMEVAVKESGARISCADMPQVYADDAQLTRVFQNLIENAIKFRKPGENLRIDVAAEPVNDEWVFTVSDNGIGMEPQYLTRIFKVFERLHGKDYPGTGIGLSICKKIVERHGGRIWAESEPDKGSKFFFTLPVKERKKNAHAFEAA